MDDHKINVLLDSLEGLFLCQTAICKVLIKNKIIKREEIGLVLDTYVKHLNEQNKNNTALFIKNLRQSINQSSPVRFPNWLQDLIDKQDDAEA